MVWSELAWIVCFRSNLGKIKIFVRRLKDQKQIKELIMGS